MVTEPGVGCRTLATVLGVLLGFAVGMTVIALSLIGTESCVGWCERAGFVAYGAGLPVSALFAAIGGTDLVVGFFTDAVLWAVAAVGVTRVIERRNLAVWRPVSAAIGLALAYGVLVSVVLRRA